MRLQPLPALSDNYIWTLADEAGAVVVDPGEAAPVLAAAATGLLPLAVLLTHHHPDHVGGTAELLRHWPDLQVFAPKDARIELPCTRVGDGDTVVVGRWRLEVLEVPGHTLSHIAFFRDAADGDPANSDAPNKDGADGRGHLFCGDTLFSLGCGRMFEGTPVQMLASLERLAALPPQTFVCCGHEYTVANAAFANVVDPENQDLRRRTEQAVAQRQRGEPTLPSTLADECAANPFLRVDAAAIRGAVARRLQREPQDRAEIFAELRSWKNGFTA